MNPSHVAHRWLASHDNADGYCTKQQSLDRRVQCQPMLALADEEARREYEKEIASGHFVIALRTRVGIAETSYASTTMYVVMPAKGGPGCGSGSPLSAGMTTRG